MDGASMDTDTHFSWNPSPGHERTKANAYIARDQFAEVEPAAARAFGRRATSELDGVPWRELLHPEAVIRFGELLQRAERSPQAWLDLHTPALLVKHPFGGWTTADVMVRALEPGRYALHVQRLDHGESVEGWDAIAYWLGVSERTARRWATETLEPMPVLRTSGGRVRADLARLLEWRDRRDVDLLCGWDAIAAHLGVSERTARRWRHRGLPVERRGGRWVGKPDALRRWRDAARETGADSLA